MNKTTADDFAPGSFEGVLDRALSRRPVKAKSLIMTIFGDVVVPRGGRIWLSSLVSLASEFGLGEPLIRTSALRLANEDWLQRNQIGKYSFYSMSERYSATDAALQSQIYNTADSLRRNGWTILRTFGDRLDRSESYVLRKTLERFGFGQIAPQCYIHPSLAKQAVHHIITTSSRNGMAGVAFFNARHDQDQDRMRELARLAWDFGDLRKGYDRFLETFDALPGLLARGAPRPDAAFRLRTLIVHEFRRLALRDPRLPTDMYSPGWPGEDAYQLAGHLYRNLLPASEAHLDTKFTVEDGKSPSADHRLAERFPGVTAPTPSTPPTR